MHPVPSAPGPVVLALEDVDKSFGAVAALRRLLPAPVGTAAQILRLCLGSCVILSVCALVYFVIDRSPPAVYTFLKRKQKGRG